MHSDQLRALLAIVDTGTFEAAARALHVTPSAISQRIKSLESQIGRPVVQRAVPCRATEAGAVLVRMARQIAVLEADALAELSPADGGPAELSVAVNADSLATWFVPVLSTIAAWTDVTVRLHVEDQDHSAALLRSGEVIGAVTSDPNAIQGCAVRPLGSMRYVPMATPEVRDAYRRGRGTDWTRMPVVVFNAKDDLQHMFLARLGVAGDGPPVHTVPSSQVRRRGGRRTRLGHGADRAARRRPGWHSGAARGAPCGRAAVLAGVAAEIGPDRPAHRGRRVGCRCRPAVTALPDLAPRARPEGCVIHG